MSFDLCRLVGWAGRQTQSAVHALLHYGIVQSLQMLMSVPHSGQNPSVARASSPASEAGVSPPFNVSWGGTPRQPAGEDARATLITSEIRIIHRTSSLG